MEKAEALVRLGLSPTVSREEIQDTLEQKLFDLKKEILQKYMVPALLIKKIQMIQDFMVTEFVLLEQKDSHAQDNIPIWQDKPNDRIDFLERYEAHISQLKTILMNCQSFDQLLKIVQSMVVSQDYYMVLFRMLFNEFSEALPEEVNTREIIDTGKLLLALKKGELDNKQIWEIELEIARIEKIMGLKTA